MINIIGGSGFIGSELSKNLRKNNIDFKVLDIQEPCDLFSSQFAECDITSIESLERCIDINSTIINLAAEHQDNILPVSKYYDVNVQGARNLCKVAVQKNVKKIIFTSSVAVYGFNDNEVDEDGELNPFNHYGKSKLEAERVFKNWYKEDPDNRTLVIIRPTVVFGISNRGNVYNLLKQIASRKFIMFGNGKNKKSMAYVENVAAFLEYSLSFEQNLYIYNYIDKPDFDMNILVSEIRKILFEKNNIGPRLPVFLGMAIGYFADAVTKITGKTLPISSIRVKKFISTTQFGSSISETSFVPPVSILEGLNRTIRHEFLKDN